MRLKRFLIKDNIMLASIIAAVICAYVGFSSYVDQDYFLALINVGYLGYFIGVILNRQTTIKYHSILRSSDIIQQGMLSDLERFAALNAKLIDENSQLRRNSLKKDQDG